MMNAEPNTQFECKLLDSGEKAFITVNTNSCIYSNKCKYKFQVSWLWGQKTAFSHLYLVAHKQTESPKHRTNNCIVRIMLIVALSCPCLIRIPHRIRWRKCKHLFLQDAYQEEEPTWEWSRKVQKNSICF